MDEFVCTKFHEWGLEQWIETFREKEIDKHRLLCLEEHEIDHLITKTGPRVKLKKYVMELKSKEMCDSDKSSEGATSVEGFSSLWSTGKDVCDAEHVILKKVKKIMTSVEAKLRDDTELGVFLRSYIANMKLEKRDMIGVFGQTGAGKSSLINAVVGEKDLLPTGSVAACTTVMIKVEANPKKQYEAEIEFITEMEWADELWTAKNLFGDTQNYENEDEDEDDEEINDLMEKLTAFYGDVWKKKSVENLMDHKYFREVPEFFRTVKKKMLCKTAKELMEKIARFTRNDLNEGNNRSFWPLVKCVTVRVPNNDLPKHITLVDLPGKGDRNKSRDEMWKKVIESCSAVWVVTNMNRAAADKHAWDILKSACSLLEKCGICQNIHFICTKTDDVDERPSSDIRQHILQRNMSAKHLVGREIQNLAHLKKHLQLDCFEVFTVSSREFLKPKYLQQNETEIPKLREFLQCLNELNGQTFSFVRGACHILSLMKEAQNIHLSEQRAKLCAGLKESLKVKLCKVETSMHSAYTLFNECLTKGVDKSRCFCQGSLQKIIHNEAGAFHSTLKCVVEKGGVHKSKHGEEINLNSTLSSFLTQSINKDFRMIFPNDGKSGPFYGAIQDFSLDIMLLKPKYRALELQLTFLKTEEEKLKMRLIKIIRNRKKVIYNSLTQTVGEDMQECYKRAAMFVGKGSQEKMRHSVETYIQEVKDTIFDHAKEEMLNQIKQLMEDVVSILSKSLEKSVELLLREGDNSIPDISNEFDEVMKHYNELMSTEEDADLLLSDSEMDIS